MGAMSAPREWFCALLDTASDVYFRYALEPERRLAYVSPSVAALTGYTPDAFYADRHLCFAVVAGADRRLLRKLLRARRDVVTTVHLVRDGVSLPVELRTVALVRRRRLVAIEGVARLATGASHGGPPSPVVPFEQPVQQRLAALLVEVHDLLHRVVGTRDTAAAAGVLRLGDLAVDPGRFLVTESGVPVSLTPLEVKVLVHFLQRPGRVVTREQLLQDVWGYSYTGDDRTVDVHVSRLRRKLPSLRDRLTALRNIGYRLDRDETLLATG